MKNKFEIDTTKFTSQTPSRFPPIKTFNPFNGNKFHTKPLNFNEKAKLNLDNQKNLRENLFSNEKQFNYEELMRPTNTVNKDKQEEEKNTQKLQNILQEKFLINTDNNKKSYLNQHIKKNFFHHLAPPKKFANTKISASNNTSHNDFPNIDQFLNKMGEIDQLLEQDPKMFASNFAAKKAPLSSKSANQYNNEFRVTPKKTRNLSNNIPENFNNNLKSEANHYPTQKSEEKTKLNTSSISEKNSSNSIIQPQKTKNVNSIHSVITPPNYPIHKGRLLPSKNPTFSMPVLSSPLNQPNLPHFEPSKTSLKKTGIIKAFAANTHQGLVRNYNEDRVAIILNILRPSTKTTIDKHHWPACSFFGIYDGHGGSRCAEFLRDNLHNYIINDDNFPSDPNVAIVKGFEEAEEKFFELAEKNEYDVEKSGSCAIVALIVDSMCYVANVGDSRALASFCGGGRIHPLSNDHKPNDPLEKKRIVEAGGKIYQSQSNVSGPNSNKITTKVFGPFRVLPGRLSVSRTFGDIEAKKVKYGGNPNVIIPVPVIKSFDINDEIDFIVLGCDGIFDKLSNREAIKSIWDVNKGCLFKNIHEFNAKGIESLMKQSLINKTLDNITVVMISFKNLKRILYPKSSKINYNSDYLKKNIMIEYNFNYLPGFENSKPIDES